MPVRNDKKVLLPVIIYLTIKPIYLFNSGSLQICDFFLAAAILFEIIHSNWKIKMYREGGVIKTLLLLIIYETIVNFAWFFLYKDSRLLFSSLFYFYNGVALIYFADLGCKNGIDALKRSCAYGIIASSAVCMLGIALNPMRNARGLGFFNNPNQLGLHGILVLTVVFFTGKYLNKVVRYFAIYISLFIIFSSASKAAFLAAIGLLLMFVLFFDKESTLWSKVRKILVLLIFATVVYLFFYADNYLIASNYTIMYMRRRILSMSSEGDSNLAFGRGYARIKELGANFIWGLGEGAYSRFSIMKDHEVHSTFANIIVSYGVLGAFGNIAFWWKLFRDNRNTIFNICGFMGIILYSITHNSMRNTLVWLLFAILFLDKYFNKDVTNLVGTYRR